MTVSKKQFGSWPGLAEDIHRLFWHQIGRCCYDKQIHGGKMGEKENLTKSHDVERDGAEDVKTVKKQPDMGGQLATRRHGDIQARATAKVRVWVYGLTLAWVSANIHGSCFLQRPHRCLEFGLPPVAVLVSKGCIATVPY